MLNREPQLNALISKRLELTKMEIEETQKGLSVITAKKVQHTHETCWKLQEKAQNQKKKPSGDGRAFQVTNTSQGQQATSKTLPFTKNHLEHLYNLL